VITRVEKSKNINNGDRGKCGEEHLNIKRLTVKEA
jgi:hypothetical protein